MAHSHYVMDLYQDDGNSDVLRREVLRIDAADDAEAISEADRINSWRLPVRYGVRAIAKSSRTNHRLVHASVIAEPTTTVSIQPEAQRGSATVEGVPAFEPPPEWDRFR
jgi:hypothetical protein